jgi:hypothetical protein
MDSQDTTEQVSPTEITKGDEIADQLGARWLTVSQVQVASAVNGGVFCFYGGGPDDRVTFEGHELVKRQRH